MPEIDSITADQNDATDSTSSRRRRPSRRVILIGILLLAILLLAILPPLINVNRFRRRIVTSISQSLGRPVHLDNVSMSLLPFPGFTIDNLVVEEDPGFGSEPIITASSVSATLRVSSLWRKRVEFSSISFTNPSVNLVHMPNGKWNIESILIQAAHITAAPTAQQKAGPAPRFPYIEATGARVNIKWGQQKLPFSLTDADFALWLSNPEEWKVRLEGQPLRTDTNSADTGTLRLEGTLGRAKSLSEVPLHLEARWRDAPLGEASRLFLGRDAGLRGQVALSANLDGTVGSNVITTQLHLDSVRRADFVPEHTIDLDLACRGNAAEAFHAFNDIHCSWPPPGEDDKEALVLTGALPNIRRPAAFNLQAATQSMPGQRIIEWLQAVSSRVPSDVEATGAIAGHLTYAADSSPNPALNGTASNGTAWNGNLQATGLTLKSAQAGLLPLTIGNLTFESNDSATPADSPASSHPRRAQHSKQPPAAPHAFLLAPTTLDLGGKDPATISGTFDASGYSLHLAGMIVLSRLTALGKTLPMFGDGLKDVLPTNRAAGPVRLDLTATRPWGGPQLWQDTPLTPPPTHRRKH